MKNIGGFLYPLVMTPRSPWYRWPIEIDGLPFLIAWGFSMANCECHNQIRYMSRKTSGGNLKMGDLQDLQSDCHRLISIRSHVLHDDWMAYNGKCLVYFMENP
jgi:hypothetical protein